MRNIKKITTAITLLSTRKNFNKNMSPSLVVQLGLTRALSN